MLGYVTALADTITVSGSTSGLNPHPALTALLKSFQAVCLETQPQSSTVGSGLGPKEPWQAPYKPLQDCSMMFLTHKTFFLVYLAAEQ